MRLETDPTFFIYCLIGLIIVLLLSKTAMPQKYYRHLLALMAALTMPAFIPGHGELVMLLPNGALFAVSSTPAIVAGLIFTVINYFIARVFLYKICHFFDDR